VADYFFICHAENIRQMQAIANAIKKELREMGVRPLGIEGDSVKSNWILVDLGDVVVHVFLPESREFYDLERLWSDAERIECATASG
jgi:ribosome-associated protein